MNRRWMVLLLVLVAGLLSACNGSDDGGAVPTLRDLNAEASATAVLQLTQAALPTATPAVQALPPTWTSAPPPAVPATLTPEVIEGAETGSSSTERVVFAVDGVIYAVAPDGGDLRALTASIGARDLALSPDGGRVAFVGNAAGSGQEVYTLELATEALLQSSALGFADVVDPAWHPNGEFLAFAAGQFVDAQREVYTVRPDGSGLTRQTVREAVGLSNPTFSDDGNFLAYSAPNLITLEVATGVIQELTIGSGWGNDLQPRWRPGTDEIYYIRPRQDTVGYLGGPIVSLTFPPEEPGDPVIPPVFLEDYVQEFDWSADGRWLALTSGSDIALLDFTTRSLRSTAEYAGPLAPDTLPHVTFSPDTEWLAFVSGYEGGAFTVEVVQRSGRERAVIATVSGTAISDLVWASLSSE